MSAVAWLRYIDSRSVGTLQAGIDIAATLRRICNEKIDAMKFATFPSPRVEPDPRRTAQSVLREGKSLSRFVEHAIRSGVERRRSQSEFVAGGHLVGADAGHQPPRALGGSDRKLIQYNPAALPALVPSVSMMRPNRASSSSM